MSAAKSPRRSWLFTPGDDLHKIHKVAHLATDSVIFDLEDAVAVNQKEAARQQVVTVLASVDFGERERFVRINPPSTEFYTTDLKAVAAANPDGIVLPKVETAVHIQNIDQTLSNIEAANKSADGNIRLFVLIETALGIMNIKEIAQASQRLDGLMFGAEDLAADMGARRTRAGWEVFYGRSALVTAATAYDLEAIDMVCIHIEDLAGLEEEAKFARQLGYRGKMAIHPAQIEIINRIFSPTVIEITQAQQLLEAYHTHVEAGFGVFMVNGRMIDKPIILSAERLLERAKLAGLLD